MAGAVPVAADIVYQDVGTTIGLGDSLELAIGSGVGLSAHMTFVAMNSIASNSNTFGWLAMDYGNGTNYINFDAFAPLVPTSSGLLDRFDASDDIGGSDFNGFSLAFGALNATTGGGTAFEGNWGGPQGDSIRGFAGFKLSETASPSNSGYYGWIDISWSNSGMLTIHGYAYSDVLDATIHAGDIPAPGALGLLGLAVGASGIRRKRHG